MIKLNVHRGSYYPSFLRMEVNVLQTLDDLNQLEELPLSTFFHEYIHFLQDITTSYGLVNANITVDYLKYVNKKIIDDDQNFDLPISIESDKISTQNNEVKNIYLGLVQPQNNIQIVEVSELSSSVWLEPPHSAYVKKISVKYKASGTESSFDFGAVCIMEGMTHIAQNQYLNCPHADIPYRAAELVAQHIYSIIGDKPLYVFALCDACLMASQPGLVFFRALIQMEKEKFNPKDEKAVFDFVVKGFKARGKNLMEHFKDVYQDAKSQYGDYFTTKVYENEKIWLEFLLTEAFQLRMDNPYFLIEIVTESRYPSKKFFDVFNTLGTPLMVNLVGNASFHQPIGLKDLHIQPDRLAYIMELYKLFVTGEKKCGLINFCDSNPIYKITDDRCKQSPWSRVNDEMLCGYAAIWKTWELIEYAPK